MAQQNIAGANMQPYCMLDNISKRSERPVLKHKRARLPICSSLIWLSMTFHNAAQSTESNAAFKSMNAVYKRQLNSQCSSESKRRVIITTIFDLPLVNSDYCSLHFWCSNGLSWASSTCTNTFPGMDRRVPHYLAYNTHFSPLKISVQSVGVYYT